MVICDSCLCVHDVRYFLKTEVSTPKKIRRKTAAVRLEGEQMLDPMRTRNDLSAGERLAEPDEKPSSPGNASPPPFEGVCKTNSPHNLYEPEMWGIHGNHAVQSSRRVEKDFRADSPPPAQFVARRAAHQQTHEKAENKPAADENRVGRFFSPWRLSSDPTPQEGAVSPREQPSSQPHAKPSPAEQPMPLSASSSKYASLRRFIPFRGGPGHSDEMDVISSAKTSLSRAIRGSVGRRSLNDSDDVVPVTSARNRRHPLRNSRGGSGSLDQEIIKAGVVCKWTNYYDKWRPRYFQVIPGALQYAEDENGPVKEQLALRYCAIRFRVNPRELDIIRSGQSNISLRFRDKEDRTEWVKAIAHAKQFIPLANTVVESQADSASGSGQEGFLSQAMVNRGSLLLANDSLLPGDLWMNMSDVIDMETIPLVKLQNLLSTHEIDVRNTTDEIRRMESRFLQTLALIRHPTLGSKIKEMAVALIRQVDSLQTSFHNHLRMAESLIGEEQEERRTLQSSLKKMARENYKLGLRLQRVPRTANVIVRVPPTAQTESPKPADLSSNSGAIPNEFDPASSGQLQTLFPSSLPRKASHDGNLTEDVFFDLEEDTSSSGVKRRIPESGSPNISGVDMTLVPRKTQTAAEIEGSNSFAGERTDKSDDEEEEDEDGADSSLSLSSSVAQDGALPTPLIQVADELPTRRGVSNDSEVQLGLPKPDSWNYRTYLSVPRSSLKISLWSLLKDCVGKDLTRVALPVYFNEPTSFLQRLAEDFQYARLLEKVGLESDPCKRMLYVSLFTVTPFASAVGRTYKPFNPLLGETYELLHRGYKFQSEQVGHHPPTTAYHSEGKLFESWGSIVLGTKFTGKSLEIAMQGDCNFRIAHPDGHFERFSYRRPRMIVNNIIFGKISIDVTGSYSVTNHTTGDFAIVDFVKKGWWSSEIHPVRGAVFNNRGECHWQFSGVWSQGLEIQQVDPAGVPLALASVRKADRVGLEICYDERSVDFHIDWASVTRGGIGSLTLAWKPDPRPSYSDKYYDFGYMTFELNEISPLYDRSKGAPVPPTDSRYRPDQRALEQGDIEWSNREKLRLEEKQRADARKRGSEQEYQPLWFRQTLDDLSGDLRWVFDQKYWNARENPEEAEKLHKNCVEIF